jgi:hypothetical protein
VFVAIIEARSSGNTNNLERFLKEIGANSMFDALETYAQQGVDALEAATPRDTGVAAGSWYYEITRHNNGCTISWLNADKDAQGTPIVIMLQYGHGTGTGGYVAGRDFINPATKQVFDEISDAVWKAVQSA